MKLDMWDVDRTDEEWREEFDSWTDVELLNAYRELWSQNPQPSTDGLTIHALWCVEMAILERMRSAWTVCPNHGGNFDCAPFCALCEGEQEYLTMGGK